MLYNGGKIIPGLVVFVGLMTFPLWYNLGKPAYARPELQKPKNGAKECVESVEMMRAEHMQILDTWRDSVVRNKNRMYVTYTGKAVNMSLQTGCMNCHSSKKEFCDKCHTSLAVAPYCWDCHIPPKEEK